MSLQPKRALRAAVVRLAIVAGAIYVGLTLSLYAFQSRLVYVPSRGSGPTPASLGIAYEDVWLTTEDGVRVHGWFVPGAPGGRFALFLHGNAGNVSRLTETAAVLHRLGLNTLFIDYRGYGMSHGEPDEAGTYADAHAAWRHLVESRGARPEHIAVIGRSLGGGVASWLAVHERPGALVLESTFTSIPDLAAEMYPWFPVRMLSKIRYDTRDRLSRIRCPVLIVHSRDDELVPFAHGRALLESAGPDAAMLEIAGLHNDGFLTSGAVYAGGLRAFLERAMPPP